jgi:hypothetical protein
VLRSCKTAHAWGNWTQSPCRILLGLALVAAGCAGEAVTDELPIQDDFSGECAWAEGEDDDLSFGCRDGEYRILLDGSKVSESQAFFRVLEEPVSSINVEADASVRAFPESQQDDAYEFHGIGCFASVDSDQGYLFLVDPSESAFGIAKQDGPKLSFLMDRTSDAIAGVGENNRIRGECKPTQGGVDLTMFVNGQEVWAVVDPGGFEPFEQVVLLVRSTRAGTDVRYDNFTAH